MDIYDQLKITPIINASGTLTSLGGAKMWPAAAEAMRQAAQQFVDLEELHTRAAEYVASRLQVEAACVSAGAAAGLVMAAAACMTGSDPYLNASLPNPTPHNKIIIQCTHRNPFDRALRMAGADLVQVGDAIQTHPFDLDGAIDEKTAAVAFFLQAEMLDASLTLDQTIQIAHRRGVPVILDAAAELPPKSNLWSLAQRGADLVIFSGGKDIRGPQPSGLIIGRNDLVQACMLQSTPHEYVVGRPMKAGKEVVVGLLAALDEYLKEDEQQRIRNWESMAESLEKKLSGILGLRAIRHIPRQPKIQPVIAPRLALYLEDSIGVNVVQLSQRLRRGIPPIYAETWRDALIINTHTLEFGEIDILVSRIVQEISA